MNTEDDDIDFEDDYIDIYEEEAEEERVYAIRPNKTQIKKEISVIAGLAEELGKLNAKQIKSFGLPEHIYNAVVQVATMPPKGARKRQLKYITGELRKCELTEIQEKLARLKSKSVHAVREHHLAERWRDKLVADEGSEILTQLLEEYPHADSQQIRQLQRNAKKEFLAGKPPKSSRLLYKYLKNLFEQATHDVDVDAGFEMDSELDSDWGDKNPHIFIDFFH